LAEGRLDGIRRRARAGLLTGIRADEFRLVLRSRPLRPDPCLVDRESAPRRHGGGRRAAAGNRMTLDFLSGGRLLDLAGYMFDRTKPSCRSRDGVRLRGPTAGPVADSHDATAPAMLLIGSPGSQRRSCAPRMAASDRAPGAPPSAASVRSGSSTIRCPKAPAARHAFRSDYDIRQKGQMAVPTKLRTRPAVSSPFGSQRFLTRGASPDAHRR
jgi:hypothetical protein